ncbi:MAG: hypothetical protein IRZ02_05720 [Acidothermus sp.]|nr:hypothetical protein [Acidothermus sp.]
MWSRRLLPPTLAAETERLWRVVVEELRSERATDVLTHLRDVVVQAAAMSGVERAAAMSGVELALGEDGDLVARVRALLTRRVPPTALATLGAEAAVHLLDAGLGDDATARIAVRCLLFLLADKAPGGAVEVRIPPIAAVQCGAGPRHTRGTPPNVVETDPRTWIALASGRLTWTDALEGGRLRASGVRSDLAVLLPVACGWSGGRGVGESSRVGP